MCGLPFSLAESFLRSNLLYLRKGIVMKRILILAALAAFLCGCAAEPYKYEKLYENLPFEMEKIQVPSIPDLVVSLSDFGGVPDAVTDNSNAFADAIAFLSSKGGGHLNVPAGIWATGPIGLESNIDLHLEDNALVSFIPDPALYPFINTIYEGLDLIRCESPIHAEKASNFSITGKGVFDGNGNLWRRLRKRDMGSYEWKRRTSYGGYMYDNGESWAAGDDFEVAGHNGWNTWEMNEAPLDTLNRVKRIFRPVMLSLRYCNNFLVEGCQFQNTPAWCLHFIVCDHFILDGVTVYNPTYASNGDALDIDSCHDAIFANCYFDAGDDGICIKSGRDADGIKRDIPTTHLLIDNITVMHAHGGFVVGSETSGGANNIKATNCRFLGTDIGLRFKSTRGRGGDIHDIWIENIVMKDIINDAVRFNLYYAAKDDEVVEFKPVDRTTPSFHDIHVKNVVSEGSKGSLFFNGLPEMPVRNIDFEDCSFAAIDDIVMHYGENISFKNTKVISQNKGPKIDNSSNVTFE